LKVRCLCYGKFFQLCPSKKNLLQGNLQNHLYSLRHTKLASDANSTSRSKSSAISTSHVDRPARSNSSVYNQLDLSRWLTRSQGDGERGELGTPNLSSVLGIMCYGFWSGHCNYNNKPYGVKALL
jgi:hypothetical protein